MSGDVGLSGAQYGGHGGGFDDGTPRLFSFPSTPHFPLAGAI